MSTYREVEVRVEARVLEGVVEVVVKAKVEMGVEEAEAREVEAVVEMFRVQRRWMEEEGMEALEGVAGRVVDLQGMNDRY
jgi:hypothetical protein